MVTTRPGRIIFSLPISSSLTGGVKTLLEHAAVLRAAGYDAVAFDRRGTSFSAAYGIDVPVLTGDVRVNADDLVVRAETYQEASLRQLAARGGRQVVFVQNHYYLHSSLTTVTRYDAIGVVAVAASSRPIKAFIEGHGIAENVALLPYAVVPPATVETTRQLRIAFMPRKRRQEAEIIRGMLALLHPDLASVPWIPIDGMAHQDAMKALAESAVFLSLQRLEGFGLTAIEAMAAGSLVTGFAGGPGCEYATAENGIWAAEDDLEAAVGGLAQGLGWLRSGAPEAAGMVAAGRATAANYSVERRDKAVLAFYGPLMRDRSGGAG
jgi:hypothetical protein